MKAEIISNAVVYKSPLEYCSFPLLTKCDNMFRIGFFSAPIPDHMGLFRWREVESYNGDSWKMRYLNNYEPAVSPRHISDRTILKQSFSIGSISTGSWGFYLTDENLRIITYDENKTPLDEMARDLKRGKILIQHSTALYHQTNDDKISLFTPQNAKLVLTFPRTLIHENIVLIPVYMLLKNPDGLSRALVWRSTNYGRSFNLYNIFPCDANANECAFIQTDQSDQFMVMARSDRTPYMLQGHSDDCGITWSAPMITGLKGGPPHLLKLSDGRILCTYGYRFDDRRLLGMGIRAAISENGVEWSQPFTLRNDGGYLSSLHSRRWFRKMPPPGNDVGYPVSVQMDDGNIMTAYYITLSDGITHIAVTKWKVN